MALLFANGALMAIVFTDPLIRENDIALLGMNAWAFMLPAILSLLFMTHFIDHVPVGAYGLRFHENWMRDFVVGLVISVLMLITYGGSSLVVGELGIENLARQGSFWIPWSSTLLILTVSAANEEILFRGYPLQLLMVAIGRWPAAVAMSVLFGLGHHLNPNATWLGTLNTFLAGMLLCVAYLRTRSLWFPYGIHIGWNLAIGPIFGFAVSGITMPSLWISRAGGSDWVTGGPYGPEGGLLGTGVMLTATIAVLATRQVCVSPTIRSLLNEYSHVVCADNLPAKDDLANHGNKSSHQGNKNFL